MDIILYILPVFLIVLLLPKYFMVLLAKCVDNALFREKIIDKEIRRKLYRNGVFADLIASFSMIVISFIKNLSDLPSYFSFHLFLFWWQLQYPHLSACFLIILQFSETRILQKKQKICTLLIFVLMTAPYYFLISPTLFYNWYI